MKLDRIYTGQKIYFKGETVPMELIAKNNLYGVVVRPLHLEEDFELLAFEVERRAYYTAQEAYEALKDNPVYSLLDFENNYRGPSNLVFPNYDFWSKEDCVDAIVDLKKGNHKISKRHGVEFFIDWNRTLCSTAKHCGMCGMVLPENFITNRCYGCY